jgi:hypothetical protein
MTKEYRKMFKFADVIWHEDDFGEFISILYDSVIKHDENILKSYQHELLQLSDHTDINKVVKYATDKIMIDGCDDPSLETYEYAYELTIDLSEEDKIRLEEEFKQYTNQYTSQLNNRKEIITIKDPTIEHCPYCNRTGNNKLSFNKRRCNSCGKKFTVMRNK